MSAGDLRVGVIGAGAIGRIHATCLAASVSGARPTAIADSDHSRAVSLGGDVNAEAVEGAEALLARPDIDAVVIATSTPFHADMAIAAASAGKPVLCEKPLASTAAEAARILDAVERADCHLQVGFQRRFDPDFQRLNALISAGELGRPRLYRSSLREPAPVDGGTSDDFILHFVIHDLDAARWIIGEIDEVTTIGQSLDDRPIADGEPENLITTLRFADGAIGVLDTGSNARFGFESRAEVVGEQATARVTREPIGNVELLGAGASMRDISQDSATRFAQAHVRQLQAFVDAIRSGAPPEPSVYDGHAAVVLAEAEQQSLREGQPVRLKREGTAGRIRYSIADPA